jgi:signal transduction histidine kinase
MSDLRPSTLDDFGLVVALQQQLDAAAAEAGWQAQYEVTAPVTRLAPALETTIFRVVQEALSNARKHAQADRVQVTLAHRDDSVLVEVRDWGRGFAVEQVAAHPERGEHLGLMGMRERVALLGGAVAIDSAPGAGTTVRIVLPVN